VTYNEAVPRLGGQLPHILMAHSAVMGGRVESGQIMLGGDIIMSVDDLLASGADYVALGHYHTGQELHPSVHFSGSLYHRSWNEIQPKSLRIVEVERGRIIEQQNVPLPSRARLKLTARMDDAGEIEFRFSSALGEEPASLDGVDVRVTVEMTTEQRKTFNPFPVEMHLASLGAAEVTVVPKTLAIKRVRCAAIVEAKTLSAKVRAWADAMNETVTPEVLALADEVERTLRGIA
jgi:DNA repair exonuclease SbcCD nuclease subunit